MDVELPIKLQTGGLTVTKEADAQVLGRSSGTRPDGVESERFEKIAHCNCRMPHKGRPEDVKEGCGAFGALEIG